MQASVLRLVKAVPKSISLWNNNGNSTSSLSRRFFLSSTTRQRPSCNGPLRPSYVTTKTTNRWTTTTTRTRTTPTTRTTKTPTTRPPPPPSPNRGRVVLLLGGGGLLVVGGLAARHVHEEVGSMEGVSRTLSFYSLAIPKYVEYRYHVWANSDDETWEELHRRTAQLGLQKILELKGFYIKSGQMCAANFGNAFPKAWQEVMQPLQDKCPFKPMSLILEIINEELAPQGKTWQDVFESMDPVPIGAASIGQVHRAKLKHGGQDVVVKIMYPEVESLFRGDVRTIKMFARVAQPVHVPPLEEIEKQFMTEFDYRKEAHQLDRVGRNLTKARLSPSMCLVPRPFLEYCTKRMLVMEEIKGDKLAVALQKDVQRHAERRGMTLEAFQKELEQREEEWRREHGPLADYVGPSAKEYETFIQWARQERRLWNAWATLYNCSPLRWLGVGGGPLSYMGVETIPLNHAQLVDDLIYLHGHEVLVDGYFNGDPHPGNILLSFEGGKPRLGLIDYGQVKRLSKEDRLLLCELIIALADDRRQDIVRLVQKAGYKSKNGNEELTYRYAKVSFDETSRRLTNGKHIQLFMEELQAQDPIESLPQNFIMVGRASIMLRGLANALRQDRSVARAWRPIAEKVLQQSKE